MSNLELNRRLVHASGVVIPISYLLNITNYNLTTYILIILTFIVLVLEYFRLKRNYTNKIYSKLTRPYESENIAGYALYIIGMLFAWILYPSTAALSGMLLLSLGDPLSGIIGSLKDNSRWLVRISLILIFSLIIIPINIQEFSLYDGIIISILASIGALIVDEFKPKINGRIIDDNLTIPVFSGLIISIFIYI